jgi:hypothetical protein
MAGFNDWLKETNNDRRRKEIVNEAFDKDSVGGVVEAPSVSGPSDTLGYKEDERSGLPSLLELFGWINILLGIFLIVLSFVSSSSVLNLIVGVYSTISGILLIATGKVVR